MMNWRAGRNMLTVSGRAYGNFIKLTFTTGCSELIFNPLVYWLTQGPVTPLFRKFMSVIRRCLTLAMTADVTMLQKFEHVHHGKDHHHVLHRHVLRNRLILRSPIISLVGLCLTFGLGCSPFSITFSSAGSTATSTTTT